MNLLICLAVLTGVISPWALPVASAAERCALVASTSGLVYIQRAGTRLTAGTNDELVAGDTVVTTESATAKLLFRDDSVIDLAASTSFKVESFRVQSDNQRQGLFSIFYGRIRALITKSMTGGNTLEFHTRDAVMGVRGTEFAVAAGVPGGGVGDRTRTTLTVVDGNVALTLPKLSAAPVSVGPNTQVTTFAGMTEMPRPQALTPSAALASVAQAHVPDNTFQRTINLDAESHNAKSPPAATATGLARSGLLVAAASARSTAPAQGLRGTGVFSAIDTISTPVITLLPGNFRTVTVQLSH